MKKLLISLVFFSLFFNAMAEEEKQEKQRPERPKPDFADEKYGPHERNVLDLWKAKSDKPAPLVIYIHGGGFVGGSKDDRRQGIPIPLIQKCLEVGISVAAINYRLSDVAPYPAQMQDGARALQYLRFKAKDFNLDPKRFASTGGSAGGGMSLWLAFHDDLADEKAEDPVLRQSTRLTCVLGTITQCSYDLRWIKKNIGGRAYETPELQKFFRVTPDELLSDKAAKLYEDASPINYLTKDDPPIRLVYHWDDEPIENLKDPKNKPGRGIHSKKFGEILKAEMEKLGLSCELLIGKDKNNFDEHVKFFVKHLKPQE